MMIDLTDKEKEEFMVMQVRELISELVSADTGTRMLTLPHRILKPIEMYLRRSKFCSIRFL
jgi:hypothetical protein